MGRNSSVSAEVVRLVFALKNDNGWNLSRIGAHFSRSKTWASQVLTRYSPESLSPNITQKRGRKRKTDEVDDGVIVGLGKHFHKDSPPPPLLLSKSTKSAL